MSLPGGSEKVSIFPPPRSVFNTRLPAKIVLLVCEENLTYDG